MARSFWKHYASHNQAMVTYHIRPHIRHFNSITPAPPLSFYQNYAIVVDHSLRMDSSQISQGSAFLFDNKKNIRFGLLPRFPQVQRGKTTSESCSCYCLCCFNLTIYRQSLCWFSLAMLFLFLMIRRAEREVLFRPLILNKKLGTYFDLIRLY